MIELNKIYNIDCFEYFDKIPDNSIDCIYTDVPYLYSIGGNCNSSFGKRVDKIKNQLEELGLTDGFNYELFFYHCFRVMKGCNLFVWCSSIQLPDFLKCISKYTDKKPIILVWCKTNPIPTCNNSWLNDIEYCICLRYNTSKLNNGYNLKSRYYISPINLSDKVLFDHPTIKPLELVERHILHSTNENDVVFDPFIGSGTTALACIRTNRKFLGCEINNKIYYSCLSRINGYDNFDLKLINKGQMTLDLFNK